MRESRRQIELGQRQLETVEQQTATLQDQTAAVREQATATKRQVALSSAALEASVRPVLVPVTSGTDPAREEVPYLRGDRPNVEVSRVHYEATADTVRCSLPVRNVGAGIAFVTRVALLTRTAYEGRITMPVIPPGERARVHFTLNRRDNAGKPADVNEVTGEGGRGFASFRVFVVYRGASHELVTSSTIEIAQLPNGEFIATRIEIHDGETGTPELLTASENVG